MANSSVFVLKMGIIFALVIFESWAIRNANKYRKCYIEDFCTDNETVVYELSSLDIRSVVKIEAFQSEFHNAERNCTIILEPPVGYSVILQFTSFTFSTPDENNIDCENYIQISGNGSVSNKFCGNYTGESLPTFTSYGNMSIIFHQKSDFHKLRSSLSLIATAYKTSPCIGKDSFLCNNGRCIWEGLACDSVNNCGDSSDEWIYRSPCSEIFSQPITDLQDLGLFSPSEVHPFINEVELKKEREFAKILFEMNRPSRIDEFDKTLYTPVPVMDLFGSATKKSFEIEKFRTSHNIPLGTACAFAFFGILCAFVRFYCYYRRCNELRRRQILSLVTVIRRRSLLHSALMNNATPPPYEALVDDPEEQHDSPPEYTAVSVLLPGEQAESPPEYTALDAIQAMEQPENPPEYALVSEYPTAAVPCNPHESFSNHCSAVKKSDVSCDLPPPVYKP